MAKASIHNRQHVQQLLDQVEWDFSQVRSTVPMHDLHPYPARFIPDLPRALIRLFPPKEGSTVFDPFCGSGTTLLEAGRAGYDSVGVDLRTAGVSRDFLNSWLFRLWPRCDPSQVHSGKPSQAAVRRPINNYRVFSPFPPFPDRHANCSRHPRHTRAPTKSDYESSSHFFETSDQKHACAQLEQDCRPVLRVWKIGARPAA